MSEAAPAAVAAASRRRHGVAPPQALAPAAMAPGRLGGRGTSSTTTTTPARAHLPRSRRVVPPTQRRQPLLHFGPPLPLPPQRGLLRARTPVPWVMLRYPPRLAPLPLPPWPLLPPQPGPLSACSPVLMRLPLLPLPWLLLQPLLQPRPWRQHHLPEFRQPLMLSWPRLPRAPTRGGLRICNTAPWVRPLLAPLRQQHHHPRPLGMPSRCSGSARFTQRTPTLLPPWSSVRGARPEAARPAAATAAAQGREGSGRPAALPPVTRRWPTPCPL